MTSSTPRTGLPRRLSERTVLSGEASWDEALDLVVSRFREIIDSHGPDAIGGVACARSINEDSYNMQKLFRAVIGTNNIDNCARTCHAPSVSGLAMSFGSGAMTDFVLGIFPCKDDPCDRDQHDRGSSSRGNLRDECGDEWIGTVCHRSPAHRAGRHCRPTSADQSRKRHCSSQCTHVCPRH